ncbi:MAG: glutathione synthase, partial [Elioraea sp.]|nr:glutathione synthase [Elioraea sp.]
MSLDVLVIMDPIASIRVAKDSSFAMLLEGQRRGHRLLYAEAGDLALGTDGPLARARAIEVRDDPADWFRLGEARLVDLGALDVVLMRRDPPVDREYLYDTLVLEEAARRGALVVNRPAALRELNEKLAPLAWPEFAPPTLAARDAASLRAFAEEHGEVVLKPLDGMGGRAVFRSHAEDPNLGVIIETLTGEGRHMALIQRYLPAIREGDKR